MLKRVMLLAVFALLVVAGQVAAQEDGYTVSPAFPAATPITTAAMTLNPESGVRAVPVIRFNPIVITFSQHPGAFRYKILVKDTLGNKIVMTKYASACPADKATPCQVSKAFPTKVRKYNYTVSVLDLNLKVIARSAVTYFNTGKPVKPVMFAPINGAVQSSNTTVTFTFAYPDGMRTFNLNITEPDGNQVSFANLAAAQFCDGQSMQCGVILTADPGTSFLPGTHTYTVRANGDFGSNPSVLNSYIVP